MDFLVKLQERASVGAVASERSTDLLLTVFTVLELLLVVGGVGVGVGLKSSVPFNEPLRNVPVLRTKLRLAFHCSRFFVAFHF
jgi:hypothetical protein